MSKIYHENLADSNYYTCDELKKWLSTEKHYSNDNREKIFSLVDNQDCLSSFLGLFNITCSRGRSGMNYKKMSGLQTCEEQDGNAVIFLSNFSINHNFSHFLHALLRLFCALVDARWIAFDKSSLSFITNTNYTIWLDPALELSPKKLEWVKLLGGKIRLLKTIKENGCASAKMLLYGSGCVRLLPPEKWYGYPGCRANRILPAFGEYIRFRTNSMNASEVVYDMEADTDNMQQERTSGRGRKYGSRHVFLNNYPTDHSKNSLNSHLRIRKSQIAVQVVFAVRKVGPETGIRAVYNLGAVQTFLQKSLRLPSLIKNISFEELSAHETVRTLAGTHVFVSVHGEEQIRSAASTYALITLSWCNKITTILSGPKLIYRHT